MITAPDALTDLVDALDGLSQALETGRAEAVLTAEGRLADAVSALRSSDLAVISRQPSARARIHEARLAIARCQVLGHVAADLVAVLTPASYGPTGLRVPSVAHATTVASRT